jgi:cytochrome P450
MSLKLSDLPGPPGLPLVGNLLQVKPQQFHLQLEAWARTYGPRFRLRLGRRDMLVVSDPAAIAAALRDRPEVIGRSERRVKGAAEMGFAGVFAVNGSAWRRQRSPSRSALRVAGRRQPSAVMTST